MPSPFPGMNPWLEHPDLWEGFHSRLTVALGDWLSQRVGPHYWVEVQQRTYVVAADLPPSLVKPDVAVLELDPQPRWHPAAGAPASLAIPEVVTLPLPEETREYFLEVRSLPGGEVVTVVELLSPKNKRPGVGRELYEAKRQKILASPAHLVEIDLLRAWEPMAFRREGNGRRTAYRLLVSRAGRRPMADLYPFSVRDPIPAFPLPLKAPAEWVEVDLGAVLQEVYDRAGYPRIMDYTRPPVPPLGREDAEWAGALLAGAAQ